jgi:ATP-dependent Clp protease ATP-binding subunit ClpA
MFERFTRSGRATVNQAQRIATEAGAPTIEAEHLLLALTRHTGGRAAQALHALGMSEAKVRGALDDEFGHALQAVGVATTMGPPARRGAGSVSGTPRFGQSAKLALGRTVQAAVDRGHKSLDDDDLLLGLTRAEAGVIPGVLRSLDLTPAEVEAALRSPA